MTFVKVKNGIEYQDAQGNMLGEITYTQTDNPTVIAADHTYVNPSLQGQGIAGKLLDLLVDDARSNNQKIQPLCSYVVAKFEKDRKYDDVNASK